MATRALVIGSGAREHALVRALAASPGVERVWAAPGNPGIAASATCVPVGVDAHDALVACVQREGITLVVIGPEAPLVAGLADALRERTAAHVFGPGKNAAQLEGSKAFAKAFMQRHGVPTAAWALYDDADTAIAAVRGPCVVKADGLAAGKGVVVAGDTAEAHAALEQMLRQRAFGAASDRVVVEDRLEGEELSLHVLLDGTGYRVLGVAQDHKRLEDGDRGPNTGGMGAYTPVPIFTEALRARVEREVVEPTVRGLAAEGLLYRGVLFIGLMVSGERAHVLEYNVRFGDPECAVLLAQVDGDAGALLQAVAEGDLARASVGTRTGVALAVVLAAAGYPTAPRKGDAIVGLDHAVPEGCAVLHAGTRRDADGTVRTDGGRVLTVTARGDTVDEASTRAYAAIASITWPGVQFRRDIAWRARRA